MNERKINKSEEEWRKLLTPEQYEVLRKKGTEPAFSGLYENEHAPGVYTCAACGAPLFSSSTKYDSGCGWPAFFAALGGDRVNFHEDDSRGMHRIEVSCAKCGSHLGHIFDDGPEEHGGKRFCINSVALQLEKMEHPPGEKTEKETKEAS
ncbi:peptide-methionine (R)-S-oxide reductase [Candidatus Uhrbacteria bacterium CG22_combo_CG10-13_8_21_14_all_47_17]|uniref:peptide-methionine (R)-S-oxide reductase n=1 Tax=Candidatus Uhrbacteria bacterium CG22_combo_CG10-13_8_21_14_all_47_17 TaxID=1975041 RepID=A0A2H0BUY1_9BACT|nr:MAG: peptide-methionine (R)-S-oxide reductase [Candidatus Uhrbacteria bacterium CG22_combo_CG10-13_8_21_14_all_47_17]